jgi:hypothetical protein
LKNFTSFGSPDLETIHKDGLKAVIRIV